MVRFVSLLAEPVHSAYRELAKLLNENGFAVEFVEPEDWREAQKMLEHKLVDVGAVCGLLYTKLRGLGVDLRPLAAPVIAKERYQAPVYFCDVVVRSDSPIQSVVELGEKTWLYNETGSWSGYHTYRATGHSWGDLVETGSHSESLRRLKAGEGEFTVLDSTFFDFQDRDGVRILESLGPFPSPLLAGYGEAAESFWEACSKLPNLPELFSQLVPVEDSQYDAIRDGANRSSELGSPHQGPFFVDKTEAFPGKEFTNLDQQQRDQAVLHKISRELLTRIGKEPTETLRSGPRFHLVKDDGLEHHHYLIAPEELENGDLSIVGFLSNRKPGADLKALFDLDAQLLDELSLCQGFLTYSPTEYEDGVWANLAVFRSPAARDRWASNSTHMQGIKDLAGISYDNIRLHLGAWPDTDGPLNWVATRYLHYTDEGVWRGVRTTTA